MLSFPGYYKLVVFPYLHTVNIIDVKKCSRRILSLKNTFTTFSTK